MFGKHILDWGICRRSRRQPFGMVFVWFRFVFGFSSSIYIFGEYFPSIYSYISHKGLIGTSPYSPKLRHKYRNQNKCMKCESPTKAEEQIPHARNGNLADELKVLMGTLDKRVRDLQDDLVEALSELREGALCMSLPHWTNWAGSY